MEEEILFIKPLFGLVLKVLSIFIVTGWFIWGTAILLMATEIAVICKSCCSRIVINMLSVLNLIQVFDLFPDDWRLAVHFQERAEYTNPLDNETCELICKNKTLMNIRRFGMSNKCWKRQMTV